MADHHIPLLIDGDRVVEKPADAISVFAQSKRAKEEELRAAYQRITRLEADLNECREYLETEIDVIDGDYCEQAPNRAMQIVTMIDETLNGVGA